MKKLEWDSCFWNVDIYNLDRDYMFYIPRISEKKYNEWLIQTRVPDNEIELINMLEDKGFRFVESKVNLMKKVDDEINIADSFKKVKKIDLEIHKNDFADLYDRYSRFSLIDSNKINDFYYKWLINTIAGKMDDACIGYYINNKLTGFISYRIKNHEFSIGLVGVFPEFQNRGISQKLLNCIHNVAYNKGYEYIKVSTQGKNHIAINTYIKNGYIFENIENWYYLRGDNYDTI